MQAKTEFEATRQHIVYAFKVFSEGFEARKARVEALREEWVENQIRKAWFNKNREYWTEYSHGLNNGSFENRTDSDCVARGFKLNTGNYYWFEARLNQASALLSRFDCAVDQLNAFEVKMSEADLTLLSTDLDDALSPHTK